MGLLLSARIPKLGEPACAATTDSPTGRKLQVQVRLRAGYADIVVNAGDPVRE